MKEMADVTVETAQLRLVQALSELQRSTTEGDCLAADPLLALRIGLDCASGMDPDTHGRERLSSVFAAFGDLVLAVRSDVAPREVAEPRCVP